MNSSDPRFCVYLRPIMLWQGFYVEEELERALVLNSEEELQVNACSRSQR